MSLQELRDALTDEVLQEALSAAIQDGTAAMRDVLVAALVEPETECRHGVSLEHNCNACSDER